MREISWRNAGDSTLHRPGGYIVEVFFSFFINLTTWDLIPGQRMCKDWSLPTPFSPTTELINTPPHPFVGPRFLEETSWGHDLNFEEHQRDYSMWFIVLYANDSPLLVRLQTRRLFFVCLGVEWM